MEDWSDEVGGDGMPPCSCVLSAEMLAISAVLGWRACLRRGGMWKPSPVRSNLTPCPVPSSVH